LLLSSSSRGSRLATFDGANVAVAGDLYAPPPGFVGGGATTAVATNDDVVFFAWGASSDASQNKLSTYTPGTWGTDLTPSALWSVASFPNSAFTGAVFAKAIYDSGQVYLYTFTSVGAFASPISCNASSK